VGSTQTLLETVFLLKISYFTKVKEPSLKREGEEKEARMKEVESLRMKE